LSYIDLIFFEDDLVSDLVSNTFIYLSID